MSIYSIEIDKGKVIQVELVRKNVKNINLTIRPDLTIFVSAKPTLPMESIEEYIKSKSSWIVKRIGRFKATKSVNTISHEYVSGESYKFLGKQYRLDLELTASSERVMLTDGYIKLFVKNKNKKTTKSRLMDEWYRKQAKTIFEDSLDRIYTIIEPYINKKPTMDFKVMKKRWGSCLRSKNMILLNLELIKAPMYCIDYVVLHELVHFIHRNHDAKFYEMLTVLMPDWKQRKEILDEEIVLFI
ncbi:MAG: hypothetical protein A2Y45_01510 [Tenericutes bacterium GWC2_34_14]|nr:MAG: hypothetical protein A2Z84_04735 [Tenericutes bacterium GWA2_35_7]OHE28216.1 MAG: hypothetical protein A2Y45_01510 [Tenericutes bacterium GWC2_34_14]OHE33158.1 MAG: hypothetical protein A2012_00570 [Tenericutes bacterium GWE2_34_108]OHE36278.1 MAG: hypothetical protein A2Y46_07560 [Tenericutes bacterium GWF1_35_14]OHE38680.1 MAG: hypothetical protein A2Y44_04670 [Tenericutes bacterium GWF2_35_184]OHE44821.1 MAG: hypothetical protein A2221_01225 [Tenericutes bacterium RIFOXYA2_FULL_36_3